MSWKRKRKNPPTARNKLVTKLDRLFSRLVRQSGADSQGICTCASCGVKKHWKAVDCGHYYSRSHKIIRWDVRNARPQCKGCNSGLKYSNKGLSTEEYQKKHESIRLEFAKTLRCEGVDTIKLADDSRQICLWTVDELETMVDEFEQMLSDNGWEK